jgi:hypothetical protein
MAQSVLDPRTGKRGVIRISYDRRAEQRARREVLREIDRLLHIRQHPKQQHA